MPKITINEISQTYTYNIGTNSYATVALPITASWGPGYFDPATVTYASTRAEMLELTQWQRFPATQAGLEAFVSTYRGPVSNYRAVKDYSYFQAITLLTSGYDVLVCRVSPGGMAKSDTNSATGKKIQVTFTPSGGSATTVTLAITAKYPGSFGNNIWCKLSKVTSPSTYWSLVVYVKDSSGASVAVENLVFVFDATNSTDNIPHISEIESKFIYITLASDVLDTATIATDGDKAILANGTDTETITAGTSTTAAQEALAKAQNYAYGATTGSEGRYALAGIGTGKYYTALNALVATGTGAISETLAMNLAFREWCYTAAYICYDILTDKLNYSPNRIISPGWDDQDYRYFNGDQFLGTAGESASNTFDLSPFHTKMMNVAYYSRCATALLDVPRSMNRAIVWNTENGYAQLLARSAAPTNILDGTLYPTHAGLCAPWAQYRYVSTAKMNIASPAFLTLMIQRAMILNQPAQYEWALPTNRKQGLSIGKFDYNIPNDYLSKWQGTDGVGVNIITNIPDLGTTLWGNSTLFEIPPATYQALANLSTRYLVNAIEDVVYRCGLAITFQYNNSQAYSQFYAGVTPTLDTMKTVGAIDDYRVEMSADIDANDQIMANSVIGKIYLVINGVINDITVDLIALPPGTDLNSFIG